MKISQEIDRLYFPRDFATMVDMRCKMDESEYYSQVYKELNELVGKEATEKIWAAYHGRIVSFPKNLHSHEYTREYVRRNAGVLQPSDMARHLNITERRVRQILQEIREENAPSYPE